MARGVKRAVCIALGLSACREAGDDPEQVRQRVLLEQQQRKLAEIAGAVRKPLPGPGPCAELSETGSALLADADFLAYLGGHGKDPYAGAGARYQLLTTGELRSADGASPLDRLVRFKRLESEHRYYAVVVVRERTLPALIGERFTPGRLSGDLVMVESGSARVVCSTPFFATSSERVAALAGGRSEAVEKDFELRIRRELEEAALRLNRGFRLELG